MTSPWFDSFVAALVTQLVDSNKRHHEKTESESSRGFVDLLRDRGEKRNSRNARILCNRGSQFFFQIILYTHNGKIFSSLSFKRIP